MANPKAMMDANARECGILALEYEKMIPLLGSCIIACAIKESKDEIVQALDRLTKAASSE